jgi:hypothetical protein
MLDSKARATDNFLYVISELASKGCLISGS